MNRWNHDCDRHGCWKKQHKVDAVEVQKIDAFPRKITGTDIDWLVEVGGGGVMIWEWKSPESNPPNDAQERALAALTDPKVPVVVMEMTGDVTTLSPQHLRVWQDGRLVRDGPIDREQWIALQQKWAAEADRRGRANRGQLGHR